MTPSPVYLVGGSKLFRHGLRVYLEGTPFEVVREIENATEVKSRTAGEVPPSLILHARSSDHQDQADSIRILRQSFKDVPVVVIAEALSLEDVTRCLAAGAKGYLLSEISTDAFSYSLQLVLLGEMVLPSQLATFWTSGRPRPSDAMAQTLTQKLSNRESDILRCLIDGSSNKAIARRLAITESTVKVHMKSLLRKLNAANRTQAAIWGMEAGFGGGMDTGNVES
ncbi:MAG: response regulator transcription factor [Alphaproteobacteria bacterium]|nr:response regulator transcription factor [Alphaproteobacteria bacterium]